MNFKNFSSLNISGYEHIYDSQCAKQKLFEIIRIRMDTRKKKKQTLQKSSTAWTPQNRNIIKNKSHAYVNNKWTGGTKEGIISTNAEDV